MGALIVSTEPSFQVKNAIRKIKKTSIRDTLYLLEGYRNPNFENSIFAKVSTLATEAGVSERTIRRRLKEAKDAGLLQIVDTYQKLPNGKNRQTSNTYHLSAALLAPTPEEAEQIKAKILAMPPRASQLRRSGKKLRDLLTSNEITPPLMAKNRRKPEKNLPSDCHRGNDKTVIPSNSLSNKKSKYIDTTNYIDIGVETAEGTEECLETKISQVIKEIAAPPPVVKIERLAEAKECLDAYKAEISPVVPEKQAREFVKTYAASEISKEEMLKLIARFGNDYFLHKTTTSPVRLFRAEMILRVYGGVLGNVKRAILTCRNWGWGLERVLEEETLRRWFSDNVVRMQEAIAITWHEMNGGKVNWKTPKVTITSEPNAPAEALVESREEPMPEFRKPQEPRYETQRRPKSPVYRDRPIDNRSFDDQASRVASEPSPLPSQPTEVKKSLSPKFSEFVTNLGEFNQLVARILGAKVIRDDPVVFKYVMKEMEAVKASMAVNSANINVLRDYARNPQKLIDDCRDDIFA